MTTARTMMTSAIAALALCGTVLASAAPAEAGYRYRHGGGAIAAGVIGGLALGAIAASTYPAYSPYPAYGVRPVYYGRRCYVSREPVFNAWGDVVYTRRVRVCD